MKKSIAKRKKRIVLITFFSLLSIILIIVLANCLKKKDVIEKNEKIQQETQMNEKEEILKIDKKEVLDNIEISNIELKKIKNNKTEIRAHVKNLDSTFSESKVIEINAIDKEGNSIAVFSGIVSSLAGLEEGEFVTQVLKDIMDTEKLEFSIVD